MMMVLIILCLALADYDNDDDDIPIANPSRGCLEAITALVGVNTAAGVQSHKDIDVYIQLKIYDTAHDTIMYI